MEDTRLIKSYVFHEDKCFFVSTIDRDSSAAYCPTRFSETIVWLCDWEKNERIGSSLGEFGGMPKSIRKHQQVCDYLFDHGNLEGFTG